MNLSNHKSHFYRAPFFLVLCLILGMASCKKKDKDSPASTPASATTGNPSTVNGSFLIDKTAITDHDTIRSTRGGVYAYFSDTAHAIDNFNVLNCSNIGQMAINNITLQKYLYQYANSYYYNDTTSTVFNSPMQISATGGSGVGAFNYMNTANYPTYSGFHALPDTIHINHGVTLPINNYFNADKVTVHILSSNNSQTGTVIVYPGNSNISFTPQDLQYLDSTSYGAIIVSFYKDSFTTIGGKSYQFRMTYNMNYYAAVRP